MQSTKTRRLQWALTIVAVVLWQAGAVHATGPAPVPEINPSSLSAGLAVLTGAVLILRSWRR